MRLAMRDAGATVAPICAVNHHLSVASRTSPDRHAVDALRLGESSDPPSAIDLDLAHVRFAARHVLRYATLLPSDQGTVSAISSQPICLQHHFAPSVFSTERATSVTAATMQKLEALSDRLTARQREIIL